MKVLKKLLLLACGSLITGSTGCVAQTDSKVDETQLYRPNFHFTPKNNWMNDPNGLFYADGVYHLYFQYWPYGNVWGPMHWGHATSTDLIQWEEQPIALYPDRFGFIFSGSAVKDVANTSGFGKDGQSPVVALFTYHDPVKEKQQLTDVESQGIAYSLDNGYTWIKYDEGNPVISNPGIRDFRDPKLIWDDINNQWLMVLAAQDRAKFYSSENLKEWKYLSDFGADIGAHGGVWECPDFFHIKAEGSKEVKWVLLQSLNPGGANGGSGTQYFVGDFDGKNFVLDKQFAQKVKNEGAVWLDYGKDNYAGVTWNNIPEQDGRRLMIGWMSNWNYANAVPTQAWRSSMTLPRELKLTEKDNGYLLEVHPVKELDNYISKTDTKKKIQLKEATVIADEATDFTQADIHFDLKKMKQAVYSFTLSNEVGEKLVFGINNKENYLFIDRTYAGDTGFSDKFADTVSKADLKAAQKEVAFRIILDKTSIEIFYNDGEKAMTEIFFISQPFSKLSANSSSGGEIHNLTINQLNFN